VLKASDAISREKEVPLVNHLVTTEIDTELLIDFGRPVTLWWKFGTHKKQSC